MEFILNSYVSTICRAIQIVPYVKQTFYLYKISCLSFGELMELLGKENEAPEDVLENLQMEENINEDDSQII